MPLGRRNPDKTESLAATAAEQVQAVIAAAEAAAAKIREEAELEAERIRAEARQTAEAARTRAATEAKNEVAQLSQSLASMRRRAEEMEAELAGLLSELPEAEMSDAGSARVPSSTAAAPSQAAAAKAADASAEEEPVAESTPEPEPDLEGARLTALNMALNNRPREEVEKHLAENFSLRDPSSLIDEVFASVGG